MTQHGAARFGARNEDACRRVDIDEELVMRLVATQFPRLAELPIRAETNPGFVALAKRTVEELLADSP